MLKKENIIKSIIVFAIIFLFMFLSGKILGEDNGIMGILIVLSTLMLLGKDLTGSPVKNFLKLSIIGILTVSFSYLVTLNIYLGLVINLVWVFIIMYVNVFNLKKPMYMSFLLTYLMLLIEKTTVVEILPRSIALIFAAIFVLLIQMLMRKKKLKGNRNPFFTKTIVALKTEIDLIVENKDIKGGEKDFKEAIKAWNSDLIERRGNNFYFTASENRQSIMMANLEKLQKNILAVKKDYEKDSSYKEILQGLKGIIEKFEEETKGTGKVEEIKAEIIRYKEISKDKTDNYNVYSINETMEMILLIIKNKNFQLEDAEITKEKPSLLKLIKYSFHKDSLRFTFAIRMSILIALCYFISVYLNLEYGKWMLFTIMSVCQPYDITTLKSGRDRIKGTILGAIVIFAIFAFIQNFAIRAGILGIGFYMFINSKSPIIKGMGTTMFSLSIVELSVKAGFGAMIITGDRVMYTIIGFIIAILGSKFIFHYDINKESKALINRYYEIINLNVKNLLSEVDIKEKALKLRASLLLTKSIESKILINNSIIKDSEIDDYIEHSRNVMINIYEVLGKLKGNAEVEEFNEFRKIILENYNKFGSKLEAMVIANAEKGFDIKDKSVLYISLAEMIDELVNTKKAKEKILL
ncbi:MAG: FUSC family protein [Sarcina sp.]